MYRKAKVIKKWLLTDLPNIAIVLVSIFFYEMAS